EVLRQITAAAETKHRQEEVGETRGESEKDAGRNAGRAVRAKRNTGRGEAKAKLIAALTAHHEYSNGGCVNTSPIANNELARLAGVDKGMVSRFFSKQFGGHDKYKAICGRPAELLFFLRLLNGEVTPRSLNRSRSPDDAGREDD
ncbi:MAG: hypothetical protein ABGY75_14485, partial [Gemmataceae bacterium]